MGIMVMIQGASLGPGVKRSAQILHVVFKEGEERFLPSCVRSLGGGDPLEEGMATHSSVLVWRIPWTEEPDGLQSLRLLRVGND